MEGERSLKSFAGQFTTQEQKRAFAATVAMVAQSRGASQAKERGEHEIAAAIKAATKPTAEILRRHRLPIEEANTYLTAAQQALSILYNVK